jgi:alpha-D-ribose 1-methylphosphonate 5-triphosphate synthase subunit PhnL
VRRDFLQSPIFRNLRHHLRLEFLMVFLSKVEAVFNIQTRGGVVVPVDFTNPDLRVRAGDGIELRGGSGCLKAKISSISFLKTRSGSRLGFVLSKEIDDCLKWSEAEIWIESSDSSTSS